MTDDVQVPEAPATPAPSAPPAHVALVEALLFASGKPASVERLVEASELTPPEVEAALEVLERALEADARGVRLDRVAGGARLVSRNEFDVPVRKLLGLEGKNKLSMASLETLSIIAYRQPVTAPEIAELRGVNSASSLRTLLDKKLITTAGRKEVVGTPFLYKTTKEFLVHFGLDDVKDLPKPEDLDALYGVETTSTRCFGAETKKEKRKILRMVNPEDRRPEAGGARSILQRNRLFGLFPCPLSVSRSSCPPPASPRGARRRRSSSRAG
ncbi:MAG: SMC-Scp complex subunit ScpB [Acidobacteria bacterium]|nr:SMC-Scp complex subunit ScpB [Acidobacteriota bacterium]